jgi:pectinesterase
MGRVTTILFAVGFGLFIACSVSERDAPLSTGVGGAGGSVAGGAGSGGTGGSPGTDSGGRGGVAGAEGGIGEGGSLGTDGGASDAPGSSAGRGGAGGSSDAAGGAGTGGSRDSGLADSDAAAGTGGAAGRGGDAGGSDGGTLPDCNRVAGQTIITVAADGSGQFLRVQAAVNSISAGSTAPTQIRIAPGTYKEKLTVTDRRFMTFCGKDAMTTILTYDDNATSAGGTTAGASTNISASDFSAENITFENSTPLGGSQAVALLTSGAHMQFRNCRFISYQDTLYVRGASQYFRNCYIAGSVDFIFGDGTAAFDNCTIYNASGGVSATAPSTDQNTPYGLVFFGGSLTAASSVKAGSVALARPWGAYGSATYLKTALGAHINLVGWVPMGTNDLTNARFSEYKSSGLGANPAGRATPSQQLTDAQAAQFTLSNLFGTWTPSYSQ